MRPPNKLRRAEVVSLYMQGLPLRAIAKQLGCSHQAVHAMLVRLRIPRRPPGGNQGSHSRRP